MKREFKEFANYIKLHDGFNRPRLDFQMMYKLFPQFDFELCKNFGQYEHFGEAFEKKNYDMRVTCGEAKCYLRYCEYYDITENIAYVE